MDYRYLIIGGGLAGASAIEGIRELDSEGAILLIGNEAELPYDRPPLSKKLWFGKKQLAEIYLHDETWYEKQHVQLVPGTEVVQLDAADRRVVDQKGACYHYEKLLLATGGRPRRLTIPGGGAEGVCYYRYLWDYQYARRLAAPGATAVVLGGGFIGSELAAALTLNEVQVTLVYPETSLAARVFPEGLGRALQEMYGSRGVTVHPKDSATAISRQGDRFVTETGAGRRLESDLLIVGIGIEPAVLLAEQAGLEAENGIVVNELLQTSHPEVYAAGDNASFPYLALGERRRVEHWDNALTQGKWAGRNMAGADQPYDHLPYFFSDLFDFGYEAVGDVDARLDTFADWQEEFATGVIYYLAEGKVRGAMMCNVWDKVEAARELIRSGKRMTEEELRGAIR